MTSGVPVEASISAVVCDVFCVVIKVSTSEVAPGVSSAVIVVTASASVVEDVVVVSVAVVGGQPSLENPLAIVSPSGQQPNAVMSQVMRRGHPSASGPTAGVWPSAQQPYVVSYHKNTHFRLHSG